MSACHWAVVARYSSPPPRVAALRRSSLEIVDGERPTRRAISLTPAPQARRRAISSRSANDRYRDAGASVTDGIPPPSRNHRTPTADDTPACTAASSLDSPRAIAAQNLCRCFNLPTGGRPGERIDGLPAQSAARRFSPIATPLDQELRRPVEFAQYTSIDYTQTLTDHGVLASVGSVGDAYDNALAETSVARFKTELIADRVWPCRSQLKLAVVEYIGWSNHDRLHEALGDRPPAEFEEQALTATLVA